MVDLRDETCVNSSMAPQAYKVATTHAHEISGWNILFRLLHAWTTHIGGMNGDIQSDLSNLAFNNGEQLEIFRA